MKSLKSGGHMCPPGHYTVNIKKLVSVWYVAIAYGIYQVDSLKDGIFVRKNYLKFCNIIETRLEYLFIQVYDYFSINLFQNIVDLQNIVECSFNY